MHWDYDMKTLRRLAESDNPIQGDAVEAFRAIAEQLEAMNRKLGTIAAELIKQNERDAAPSA